VNRIGSPTKKIKKRIIISIRISICTPYLVTDHITTKQTTVITNITDRATQNPVIGGGFSVLRGGGLFLGSEIFISTMLFTPF
jgi:hypothetical protein